jgi:putative ribosome biogenesis GTPase RsgA
MDRDNLDFKFKDILDLARMCKFTNCTHTKEPHCAVKKAISEGVLSKDKFNAYYREIKEEEHILNQKNRTKAIDYMKQRKLFQEPPK